MKILVDTNIIVDYLSQRKPYMEYAEQIIDKCGDSVLSGYISLNMLPLRQQVFYFTCLPEREHSLQILY